MKPHARLALFLAAIALITPLRSASAQLTGAPAPGYKRDPGMVASAIPAPLREIGFDQNLDRAIPLDLSFKNEEGRTVQLREYFGKKPVVLALVYYECPMLCSQVLGSLTKTLRTMSMEPGQDFEIVTVSFDPRETPGVAATKKAEFIARLGKPAASAGWHFLTGEQAAITSLTQAAGFRYAWDEETKQFAHPTGIIVLTPDGRPARYLFGVEYGPRDLRLALVEASEGRIGSKVDSLLLYCYHYDPMTGRYGLVIMEVLRIAGIATVLGIGGFIFIAVRRERPAKRNLSNRSNP